MLERKVYGRTSWAGGVSIQMNSERILKSTIHIFYAEIQAKSGLGPEEQAVFLSCMQEPESGSQNFNQTTPTSGKYAIQVKIIATMKTTELGCQKGH